ncbi:hypothetical protein ACJJTC_000963 [Scirpophaga incertulas]
MYRIIRVLLLELWIGSTITVFASVFVYFTIGCIAAFAIFSLGMTAVLYNAQDLLLYYPNDPPDSRHFVLQPCNYGLPYETIKVKTKDGQRIHMFFIKQETGSSRKATMIFFHGNAGNMGQRLSNVSGFYHQLGINILMVEYRGYGLSEGTPSEHGFYIDAQTAFNYLVQRTDIDRDKIFLFGRSLGGAVAIDLATEKFYRCKFWAVIVENTFTSIPDMAQVILKWRLLRWVPMWFYKNRYMSLHKICRLTAPTLFICGENDTLVPPGMTRALHRHCRSPWKQLLLLRGGHDDTWLCRDYYPALQQFLRDLPAVAENNSRYDTNKCDEERRPGFNVVHTV